MGTVPRVVVTGMGAETALGHGVGALWEGALLGWSAIRPVTRFDTRRFHARQAALIDRERAERHGARGPSSTVSVACASGAAAVGLAAEWIREGCATWVLAGGADAISPFV